MRKCITLRFKIMRVICFATQKGGSGKSTVAINCAVIAEKAKNKVLIIDMDMQGSALHWYQEREADTPQVIEASADSIESTLEMANEQNFDYVIIDTAGRDEHTVAVAIKLSDFCVIPCRPSSVDMVATPETVKTARKYDTPAAIVLTQTLPRGSRPDEAGESLSQIADIAPVWIVSRVSYQDAMMLGLGVSEHSPNGKATAEIKALWQWITKKLRKR